MSELRKPASGEMGGGAFSPGAGEHLPANPTFQSINSAAGADRPVPTYQSINTAAADIPTGRPGRKKQKTLAAVSAAVLAVSACAPSPDARVSDTRDPQRIETVLPDQLPDAVAAQLGVVDIGKQVQFERDRLSDGRVLSVLATETSFASGVKLDNEGDVATAKHAVGDEPHPHCGDLQVRGRAGQPSTVRKAQADRVANSPGTQSDAHPDMAIIHVDPDSLAGMPAARLRQTPLQVGEPVFLVGFQPVADNGADRSPDKPEPYSEPAITGGIVISTGGQLGDIAIGLHGYGPIPDADIRGGDSGGAVYDRDGNLLALVTNMVRDTQSGEAAQFVPSQAFHTDLAGYPGRKVSLAKVQPVTQELVDLTKRSLNAAPPCDRSQPREVLYIFKG